MVGPAWERVVLNGAAPEFEPSLKTGSGRFEQLELDRPASLLPGDRGPCPDPAAADKLADPDLKDVAAAQLAARRVPSLQPTEAGMEGTAIEAFGGNQSGGFQAVIWERPKFAA